METSGAPRSAPGRALARSYPAPIAPRNARAPSVAQSSAPNGMRPAARRQSALGTARPQPRRAASSLSPRWTRGPAWAVAIIPCAPCVATGPRGPSGFGRLVVGGRQRGVGLAFPAVRARRRGAARRHAAPAWPLPRAGHGDGGRTARGERAAALRPRCAGGPSPPRARAGVAAFREKGREPPSTCHRAGRLPRLRAGGAETSPWIGVTKYSPASRVSGDGCDRHADAGPDHLDSSRRDRKRASTAASCFSVGRRTPASSVTSPARCMSSST